MRRICKMEELEIRAVIKYFGKKGMPPKEIHEDLTLGKESSSYITVKKWVAEFKRGRLRHALLDRVSTYCQPTVNVFLYGNTDLTDVENAEFFSAVQDYILKTKRFC